MEDQHAHRAEQFIIQAEKALKRFSIFSSSSKFEDACEFYQKAGNAYKVAKKWQEAGDVFAKCVDLQNKLSSPHEAATFAVEAANCHAKVNPHEAISFYRSAISQYCEIGRFGSAAKLTKQIAETFERDGNMEEAVENYRQASDYFIGENQKSQSNQCLLKVAELSAQMERYEAAIDIYEGVAGSCLESNLLRFNAKGYYFQAALLILCTGDYVRMTNRLESWKDLDYTFGASRECKFLEDVTKACEEYDADSFTDAVFNYDSVSKLDAWKTTMLLRVKNSIAETGEEAPDLR